MGIFSENSNQPNHDLGGEKIVVSPRSPIQSDRGAGRVVIDRFCGFPIGFYKGFEQIASVIWTGRALRIRIIPIIACVLSFRS